MKGYLDLNDGTVQEHHINILKEDYGDVSAVFVDAFSNKIIDSECGVKIYLELDMVAQWVCDFRHCEFWCMSAFGKELSEIPDETQGLILKMNNDSYTVILPVVSEEYKCVLCGENNNVVAKIFSWSENMTRYKGLAFMIANGNNPYTLGVGRSAF